MQMFEALSLSLHGCRVDEQSESVSGAKPRFWVVFPSVRQDALTRMVSI